MLCLYGYKKTPKLSTVVMIHWRRKYWNTKADLLINTAGKNVVSKTKQRVKLINQRASKQIQIDRQETLNEVAKTRSNTVIEQTIVLKDLEQTHRNDTLHKVR